MNSQNVPEMWLPLKATYGVSSSGSQSEAALKMIAQAPGEEAPNAEVFIDDTCESATSQVEASNSNPLHGTRNQGT